LKPIEHVIESIDTHLADFKSNPILGPMADELKAQYIREDPGSGCSVVLNAGSEHPTNPLNT
jgi:hypothetical protein